MEAVGRRSLVLRMVVGSMKSLSGLLGLSELSMELVAKGNLSVRKGITGLFSNVPSITSMPSSSLGIWSNIDGVGLIGLLWGLKTSWPGRGIASGIPITSLRLGGC